MNEVADDSSDLALHRCERCWSTEDVHLFHFMATGQPIKVDNETGVLLCNHCRARAPRDPLVFKEIFLRFGSPKELMATYSVSTEREALEKLCSERNLDFENMLSRLNGSRVRIHVDKKKKNENMNNLVHLRGPFGYQYDDNGMIINEAEAKVVIEIFNLYLNGLGIAKICRELNRRGFKTRTGKAWASQTIANILGNPIYCGYTNLHGEIKRANNANLISVNLYNRVQKEMQRRIRRPDQKSESCLILPQKEAELEES